jgi:hypothetical protein
VRADRKTLFAVLALLFFWPHSSSPAAEIDVPRVLEARGGPEVLLGARWNPLVKGARLPKGTEVRTPPDAWVLFAFDAALESIGQLGPDSRLAMRGGPGGPVFLEKGKLFLLREPHRKEDVFLIATADARVYVESGGVSAEVKSGATSVRVFGDRVRVGSGAKSALKDVTEGFELRVRRGETSTRRMAYDDYTEWLAWVKRSYEIKDDADERVLEKEYGL